MDWKEEIDSKKYQYTYFSLKKKSDHTTLILLPKTEILTFLKQIPLWVNNLAEKLRKDKFSPLGDYVSIFVTLEN